VIVCLYGALLFIAGIGWLRGFWEYRHYHHDWQEIGFIVSMLTFLPAALAGLKLSKIAAWWFFVLVLLCAAQALGVTNRTGDATGAEAIGMLGVIGLPALAAGLLFRNLSKS
jgi:hypothetical protein